MKFKQLKLGPMENFSYVIGDASSGEAAVVDPAFEHQRLLDAAASMGLNVSTVLVTHGHRDHVAQVDDVVAATGARVVAHPDAPVDPDVPVGHGDVVPLGDAAVTAYHTPGHKPDHVIYQAGDYLLTGDLLFVGECGRTDLPGGDSEAMWHSFFDVLAELRRDLVVCPGHDYGPRPTSTLGEEFETNYTLEERSLEEFKRFMAEP